MDNGLGISPFLSVAQNACSVRKIETILPIACLPVVVSPLMTGDDLDLRSAVVSPVNYDRQLCKIFHKHTKIEDPSIMESHISFQDFCSRISNIDKLSLMWGLYKASYDYLAKERSITCNNSECGEKFKVDIYLDDLIHDDTYIPWNEKDPDGNNVHFTNFYHPFKIDYENVEYHFLTKLPSIEDNNMLLGMISIDTLQYNLDTIGEIYTKPQLIASTTQSMRIVSKDGTFEPTETDNIQEILMALQSCTPYSISEEYFKQYDQKFKKYVPKFYKMVKCPHCSKEFNYNVDMELEFFRRAILDGK